MDVEKMEENSGMKYRSIRFKFMLAMVIVSVLTALVLVPTVSNIFRAVMEDEYAEKAFAQTAIAAALIDGDSIERYRETGQKDDYYEEVRQMLLTMKRIQGFKFFYVVIPTENEMYYIWDVGEEWEDGLCELLETEGYVDDKAKTVMLDAFSGEEKRTVVVTDSNQYGYIASAYMPIYNSRGEAVALSSVDISMDKINKQIGEIVVVINAIIFIILLVCQLAFYIYMKMVLVNPLRKMYKAVANLVSKENMENLSDFYIGIHTRDEIQAIADAFNAMTKQLDKYINNLATVTKEKERIGAELELANSIQSSMLPNIFPPFPDRKEFDIYANMTPAKEVGGDFYDFFMLDDDHLGLVIADVSGKGVPAALFMMMSKLLVNNFAYMGGSPSEILASVNDQICKNNKEEMFVTIWLGILTISTGKVIASNAGHEFPFIKSAEGNFEMLEDEHGFVIGGMEGMEYQDYEFTLEKGSTLFIYTDGLPEATNAENELFGMDRILEVLNKEPDAEPKGLLRNMTRAVDGFVKTVPRFDDLTMLALKINRL